MAIALYILIGIIALVFFGGIRVVRPTHRAVVERLGKYYRYLNPGFNWVIPIIDGTRYVNITERMMDIEPQDIITQDNLNAKVDLVVYYKVKANEENIKKSLYNINVFQEQIISLAQTTARNVIGDMVFKDVNSKRNKLNTDLKGVLDKESDAWGVGIVRVEMKEITPPENVQTSMNKIIMAENEKRAAVDMATANETKADGERRADIKKAEGKKRAQILEAEGEKEAKISIARGEAEAIKLVNESAERYFKGNAQTLKKLKVAENALKNNSKIVIPSDSSLINVIGQTAGVLPIIDKAKGGKRLIIKK